MYLQRCCLLSGVGAESEHVVCTVRTALGSACRDVGVCEHLIEVFPKLALCVFVCCLFVSTV